MEVNPDSTTIDRKRLAARVLAKFSVGFVVIWLALFLPAGSLAFYLSTPLVLGSFWALIPAACYIPLLAIRIRDEEALLLRELPGYVAYCAKLRWRLMPGIW